MHANVQLRIFPILLALVFIANVELANAIQHDDSTSPAFTAAVEQLNEEVQQLSLRSPNTQRDFIAAVSLMNYIQRNVSPLRYSVLAAAKKPLPTSVNQCLTSGAGICGSQVACFLQLALSLNLRARPVEIYFHGATPNDNSSHIGVEVFFDNRWNFFDVTWGTYFQQENQTISFADVRKAGPQSRRWAVTNQTDQWFLHWKRAGLDPLTYIDAPQIDILYGHKGTIRIHQNPDTAGSTTEAEFKPVHQPTFIGLNSLNPDYGAVAITLMDIPANKQQFVIDVSGTAGKGKLVIAQSDQLVTVQIESLKTGENLIRLPFQLTDGNLSITLKMVKPRQIGYVVYSKISIR